ncbi:Fur family transcriptional regulator [Microvirga flavescens]|uniref:Fur family transcriptional regulator n=1 Tax=Microvirga flavescens TaxID=2249811 RepID=UPI0018E07030|nr:Fur family transcriptional regulator [Microvirga flavescens]
MSSNLAYAERPHQEDVCAHAARQSERAPRAMAQAEAVCRSNGARLTPIRRNVLAALYSTHKPLGAYELAEIVAPGGRRIAPITIYRALEFLIEQGLAHRLASKNAYVASLNGGAKETAAFLICEDCGGVDETMSEELSNSLLNILGRESFQSREAMIEITGRCSHCQNAAH